MALQLGPLLAEVIHGEGEKFTSPLVMLHGLWQAPSVWYRFAGYLAHRGWHCFLPDLQSGGAATRWSVLVKRVSSALDAIESSPILVGYDTGALLALHHAWRTRATVALAPPQAADLLPSTRSWVRRLRGSLVPAPTHGGWSAPAERGRREHVGVLEDLRASNFSPPAPVSVPVLITCGDRDSLAPTHRTRQLAERLGATFQIEPDVAHDLPTAPGWEARVSRIHRWIIQRLGEPLLALYEEEDEEASDDC